MLKRTIVGLALIPVLLLAVLVFPKWLTAIVAGAFCAIAAYEMLVCTKLVRNPRMQLYTMLAAFFVSIWSMFGCPGHIGALLFVLLYGLLFSEVMLSGMKIPLSRVALCMLGGLVIPYMFNALIRIFMMEDGRAYILIPFVVAFLNDIGAYFAGSFLGKRKLCPTISPNKTVEGLYGGLAASVLGLIIYCLILQLGFGFRVNYFFVIIYGLVGGLAGVFGDLSFSVIKRQTGIKDYGNIFPGHGGILDRFDSVIVVAPLIEALLHWIPVVS